MTSPRWSVLWTYAGERGLVEGVDVQWSESSSLARVVGSWRTAGVRMVIPLDVMALASRGHHPMTGTALLSYGDAPVLSGSWDSPAFDPLPNGSTRIEFVISQRNTTDRGVFPSLSKSRPVRDPNERVGWGDLRVATPRERIRLGFEPFTRNALDVDVYVQDPVLRRDKWPNIAEPAEGAGWAYPFGQPGRGAELPAVPAYCVVDSPGNAALRRILLAGTSIDAATVTMWGPSTAGGTDLVSDTGVPVLHDQDEDGFTYAYVIGSALTNVNASPANVFYWSSPGGTTTPGGAGDLLITILSASTLSYDAAEFARLRPVLNRYQLDGYVDALTPPLELITDQILPLLPIAIVPGPNGLRPVLLPFADDRAARGIAVVDGIGVASEGAIRYVEPDGTASVAVRYGFRADRSVATRRVKAEPASVLLSRFGRPGLTEVDARFVWDPITAWRIAEDAAVLGTWSPRAVSLAVTQRDTYGMGAESDLYVGRRVLFTSSRLGLSQVTAIVGEREIDATRNLVRLWLLDDPVSAR